MADAPKPLEGELVEARDTVLLADPEQLELIRDQVPGRDAGTAVAIAERRGRGRPRGSLNRRNAKFRDQVLALGPHPAQALMRAYSTPVEVLAAELGCSKLEAAQLGMRAAAELLPYIEGKAPVAVELRKRHDVVMIMAGGAGVTGEQLDAIAERVNEADGLDLGDLDLETLDWSTASIEAAPGGAPGDQAADLDAAG